MGRTAEALAEAGRRARITSERRRLGLLTCAALLFPFSASAHIGSPDVFFEGDAGPHHMIVTIRPPLVIPGVADIDVRVTRGEPSRVLLLPMRLTGPGARFAPTPDVAERSADDPHFFTGHLWLMTTGEWQVRVRAEGPDGDGEVAIPVTAVATRTFGMDRALGVAFFAMMLVLAAGLVSILGASFREADLDPGVDVPQRRRRTGRIAMAVSTAGLAISLALGNRWWDSEARAYSVKVYKPLKLDVRTEPPMEYRLVDPGWLSLRRLDDLVPDHNHLMHLFAFNEGTGTMYHMHPRQTDTGAWRAAFEPPLPGHYRMFADIVHRNGLPETAAGECDLAGTRTSGALAGDDSAGGPTRDRPPNDRFFEWSDGSRMARLDAQAPLVAGKSTVLRFDVIDAQGEPARDLELYMGMPAHAVIVKRDWSVFAHIHSGGSVPMALLEMASRSGESGGSGRSGEAGRAGGFHDHQVTLPSTVSFPYGFPSAGEYLIYVQVRRTAEVKTAVFGISVEKQR